MPKKTIMEKIVNMMKKFHDIEIKKWISITKLLDGCILFSALVFTSCVTSENAANRNVAGIYMQGINLLEPDYKVFHENDSLTQFYFRLKSEDLLYTKKRYDSVFTANVQVSYQLMDELDVLIDSSTIYFSDFGKNNQKKYLQGQLTIHTEKNRIYNLLVSFYDANRDNYMKKKITLNRANVDNGQNFLATDSLGNILFKNYLAGNDYVVVHKSNSNTNQQIGLKYFRTKHAIAKPPFSETERENELVLVPDSSITLTFDSANNVSFVIDGTGMFFLQTNEMIKEGPTYFCFQNNFPEIHDVENMIEPMRYITTKEEYINLLEAEDKKIAMDDFWLGIAGGTERARTLIKEYFTRVEGANHFFTSYLEGWKTDRGLIYLIYGTPSVVYKNKEYENWIYGEENNVMSMNFVFYKVNNPITGNDYSLSRSSIYKSTWYRAVDTWRNGRIF